MVFPLPTHPRRDGLIEACYEQPGEAAGMDRSVMKYSGILQPGKGG